MTTQDRLAGFSETKLLALRKLLERKDIGRERTLAVTGSNLKVLRAGSPVLFIYPAVIGLMDYAADHATLRSFRKKGAVIGGHGYYHLILRSSLFSNSRKDFEKEIVGSTRTLVRTLGADPTVFAYPFGVNCPEAVRYLKLYGYRQAFTITWGSVIVPLSLNPDPFRLPRYMVTPGTWGAICGILKKNAEEPGIVTFEDERPAEPSPTGNPFRSGI